MNKFVIASHGTLAEGYKNTLEIITGINDVSTICGFVNDHNPEVEIRELMASFDNNDDVYIFTDIAFGSVNRLFIPFISENRHLISGINLPLLCELLLKPNTISREEILEAIENAKQQIKYMNYEIEKINLEN